MSPGAKAAPAPVVDVHPVRRRRGKFVPVERGVGGRDDRPRVRVGGRFAGEVAGIELRDGGVEVVEVEHDDRRDPSSALISTTPSTSTWNASGSWSSPEKRARREDEALAAGRDDVDVTFVTPRSAAARRFAISASRPCRTPAFTTRRRSSLIMSSASISVDRVPVAGREVRQKRSSTWLAAFSSRGAGRLS